MIANFTDELRRTRYFDLVSFTLNKLPVNLRLVSNQIKASWKRDYAVTENKIAVEFARRTVDSTRLSSERNAKVFGGKSQ